MNNNEKYLGIDYGDYTIGLAIYDYENDFIYPLKTILREKANVLRKSVREIVDIIKKEKIRNIVVGLPLNFDGTSGNRVTLVMSFVHMLINKLNIVMLYNEGSTYLYNNGKIVIDDNKSSNNTTELINLYMQDERLTTQEASQILSDRGIKKSEQKKVIDQVAAEIILQEFKNQILKN